MRNLLIILSLAFLNIACHPDQPESSNFVIEAEISNADSSMVYLMSRDDEWNIIDSSIILNGTFRFTGEVSSPEMHYVRIGQSRRNMISVFLENSEYKLKGNFDSLNTIDVSGGELHKKYKDYKLSLKSYDQRSDKLYEDYMLADSIGDLAKMTFLDSMWENLDKERQAHIKNIVYENSNNPFGPYLVIGSELNYGLELPEFEEIFSAIDSSLTGTVYYQSLEKRIAILKSIQLGAQMPSFSQQDTAGQIINSDSFRGKYLLVDFWASWCGPCRRENPNVVAMYNELKNRGVGFEILGVSLDDSREDWIGAIEQDGLTWPQVSDLGGWSNAVSKQYGIVSIPHTVLVSPEGEIIAHKLRGEELKRKLEELLIES